MRGGVRCGVCLPHLPLTFHSPIEYRSHRPLLYMFSAKRRSLKKTLVAGNKRKQKNMSSIHRGKAVEGAETSPPRATRRPATGRQLGPRGTAWRHSRAQSLLSPMLSSPSHLLKRKSIRCSDFTGCMNMWPLDAPHPDMIQRCVSITFQMTDLYVVVNVIKLVILITIQLGDNDCITPNNYDDWEIHLLSNIYEQNDHYYTY